MSDGLDLSRRDLLLAVGGLSAAAAVGGDAISGSPSSPSDFGVGGVPGVLMINPGSTHRISSDGAESYRQINWGAGGELVLEDGAELTMTE